MSDKIYAVPADWTKRAFIDDAKYKDMYAASIKDPDGFWREQAKRIDWIKPFTKVKNTSYAPGNMSVYRWMPKGSTAAKCSQVYGSIQQHSYAVTWRLCSPSSSAGLPVLSTRLL